MDNQGQNPVQLPPSPLPINPNPQPQAAPQPLILPQPAPVQPAAPSTPLPTTPAKRWTKGRLAILAGVILVVAIGGWLVVRANTKSSTKTTSSEQTAASQAAAADLQAYKQPLDQFFAKNKYYPSDITQPTLSALNIQIISSLSPPPGTSYQYVATPAGCTTKAKNCTAYTLSTIDDNTGKALAVIRG